MIYGRVRKITIPEWQHIPAGTTIANGYSNSYCTAPKKPGFYTLYQLVDPFNFHRGWKWEREEDNA